jgi:Lon protease-like protein
MPTLELPVFPLDIVLFPGTPQLLHIFEPRYRQMLADCLEGNRQFGISYVKPDESADDRTPAPGDIGCCAVIRESRLLPDGRSNILVVGAERYVLQALLPTGLPYLVGRVETIEDEDADTPQLDELAAQVRSHFTKFVSGMQTLSDRSPVTLPLDDSPVAISFQVAGALELDAEVKQDLLQGRSTLQRLETLLRMLRPLNDELDQRVTVHRRARGNGRGGKARDVVTGS